MTDLVVELIEFAAVAAAIGLVILVALTAVGDRQSPSTALLRHQLDCTRCGGPRIDPDCPWVAEYTERLKGADRGEEAEAQGPEGAR